MRVSLCLWREEGREKGEEGDLSRGKLGGGQKGRKGLSSYSPAEAQQSASAFQDEEDLAPKSWPESSKGHLPLPSAPL